MFVSGWPQSAGWLGQSLTSARAQPGSPIGSHSDGQGDNGRVPMLGAAVLRQHGQANSYLAETHATLSKRMGKNR